MSKRSRVRSIRTASTDALLLRSSRSRPRERICSALKALGARRVAETNAWREGGHRSAAHCVAEADDAAWARRLHVERRAHELTDPDGTYRLEARLAPDAGARFSSAWKAHTDRIFRDARRAGRREPHAAYAADALVALAGEGPCKPVEVRAVVDSAALARGHVKTGERCEIASVGPVPVAKARALLDDASVAVMMRDGDDITAVSRRDRSSAERALSRSRRRRGGSRARCRRDRAPCAAPRRCARRPKGRASRGRRPSSTASRGCRG
jgi:hypothetical protein